MALKKFSLSLMQKQDKATGANIMATKNVSNIIFCGLVAGYQGEGNTATPENAAEAVAEALRNLGAEAAVSPAVCVYHTDWGCPVGGEPVGAFSLSGEAAETLATCETLRRALSQSTLSVGLQGCGTETIGFKAYVSGASLKELGSLWQKAAAEAMVSTGTYVSCGIAEEGDHLVVSAEANPEFVQDLDAWRSVVKSICEKIGAEPVFETIGFNYLKD